MWQHDQITRAFVVESTSIDSCLYKITQPIMAASGSQIILEIIRMICAHTSQNKDDMILLCPFRGARRHKSVLFPTKPTVPLTYILHLSPRSSIWRFSQTPSPLHRLPQQHVLSLPSSREHTRPTFRSSNRYKKIATIVTRKSWPSK